MSVKVSSADDLRVAPHDERSHPQPTSRAREIVAGSYDLHVHVAPDIIERRTTDVELAAEFEKHELGGFVLKSHYAMTAERAAVVRAVTTCDVQGALVLNWGIGGINPLAVEVCARVGGRVVWMPTIDAHVKRAGPPGATAPGLPPAWQDHSQLLADRGVVKPAIRILDADGALTPDTRLVLELIAGHDMVLCTGHLDRDDALPLVREARSIGVRRIVITHPDARAQRFTREDQVMLAEQGCLLERCFGTPYARRVSWESMFANIRAVGVPSNLISSDLGQVHNPPVEDGVALMADQLLDAGFSDSEVRTMTVENSRSLFERE